MVIFCYAETEEDGSRGWSGRGERERKQMPREIQRKREAPLGSLWVAAHFPVSGSSWDLGPSCPPVKTQPYSFIIN